MNLMVILKLIFSATKVVNFRTQYYLCINTIQIRYFSFMNILVTGANGQLGSELRLLVNNPSVKDNYIFSDIISNDDIATLLLDISDIAQVRKICTEQKIGVIINCAAYTNVDKAEDEPELADIVNHKAVANLATVAHEISATLFHVSTDYVFDGCSSLPYIEESDTNPIGVYGETKLRGELAVKCSNCNYLIFRTSWLYSKFGKNFVKTISRLSAEKESLNVVFDQIGTPTYAKDLANVIFYIIENKLYENNNGVYHFSNEGVCSWYDFACDIVRLSGNNCKVYPCHSDEFPSKVKRPHYSVLDKSKVKHIFAIEIPHWRESLTNYMSEVL